MLFVCSSIQNVVAFESDLFRSVDVTFISRFSPCTGHCFDFSFGRLLLLPPCFDRSTSLPIIFRTARMLSVYTVHTSFVIYTFDSILFSFVSFIIRVVFVVLVYSNGGSFNAILFFFIFIFIFIFVYVRMRALSGSCDSCASYCLKRKHHIHSNQMHTFNFISFQFDFGMSF